MFTTCGSFFLVAARFSEQPFSTCLCNLLIENPTQWVSGRQMSCISEQKSVWATFRAKLSWWLLSCVCFFFFKSAVVSWGFPWFLEPLENAFAAHPHKHSCRLTLAVFVHRSWGVLCGLSLNRKAGTVRGVLQWNSSLPLSVCLFTKAVMSGCPVHWCVFWCHINSRQHTDEHMQNLIKIYTCSHNKVN